MSNWLDKLQDLELTPEDIIKICDGKTRVVTMLNTFDFMTLFEPYDCFVMFYPTTSPTYGHYSTFVLLKNVIYHWDSYGFTLEQLHKISDYTREHSKNNLQQMIAEACNQNGLTFVENTKRFQEMDDDIATCGRYAGLRCRFNEWTNAQFDNFLLAPKVNTDKLVSLITMLYST